eukprot:m.136071 g.136071  ORF g.136071 m.136071 type:complete len:674 (+) comp16020_c0_seq2:67-2088(+)
MKSIDALCNDVAPSRWRQVLNEMAASFAHSDEPATVLMQQYTQRPELTSIFSTVAGLLNSRIKGFGAELVVVLMDTLRDAILNHHALPLRNTLFLLADLENACVVQPAALASTLQGLLSLLETGPDLEGFDWQILNAVMACLPLVGRDMSNRAPAAFEKLFTTIKTLVQRSHLPKTAPEHDRTAEHTVLLQLTQLTTLAQADWCEDVIPRPYIHFGPELASAPAHSLAELDVLAYSSLLADLPEPLLPAFHLTQSPDVPDVWPLPPKESAERWLVSMHVGSIAKEAAVDERRACQRLLSLASLHYALATPVIMVETIVAAYAESLSPTRVGILHLLFELVQQDPSSAEAMVVVMTTVSRRAHQLNSHTLWQACQLFAHLGAQVVWDLPWSTFEAHHKETSSAFLPHLAQASAELSYPARIRRELTASFAALASDVSPTNATGPLLGLSQELKAQYQLDTLLQTLERREDVDPAVLQDVSGVLSHVELLQDVNGDQQAQVLHALLLMHSQEHVASLATSFEQFDLVTVLKEHMSATTLTKVWFTLYNLEHTSARVAMEQLLQSGALSPAPVLAELVSQAFKSSTYSYGAWHAIMLLVDFVNRRRDTALFMPAVDQLFRGYDHLLHQVTDDKQSEYILSWAEWCAWTLFDGEVPSSVATSCREQPLRTMLLSNAV